MNTGSPPPPPERTPADRRPVFVVTGPDGSVELDLSVPGEMGDLAFSSTQLKSGRTTCFGAYHTGEAEIVVQLLQAMAAEREPARALADVSRIRTDVGQRTDGVACATTVSENSFERLANELSTPRPWSKQTYAADSRGRRQLTVTGSRAGVTFEITGVGGPAHALAVPQDDLWRVVAGVVWRSFSDRQTRAPLLTRLSTAAFDNALNVYEGALQRD